MDTNDEQLSNEDLEHLKEWFQLESEGQHLKHYLELQPRLKELLPSLQWDLVGIAQGFIILKSRNYTASGWEFIFELKLKLEVEEEEAGVFSISVFDQPCLTIPFRKLEIGTKVFKKELISLSRDLLKLI